MKKCSTTVHKSLTELNITPLLDLAFVLLVIFILTTTPLANDIPLKLPPASTHQKDPPHSVKYVTVESNGAIWLDKSKLTVPELQTSLLAAREDDSNTSVVIRGDSTTKYRLIRAVLDDCQQVNILKVDMATEAADKKK
jgi:biopolymer transport protein ExbD